MRTEIFRIRARVPENLTFAFVSDIHEANCGPVLEQINVWSPDAVLIGGDFVHSPSTDGGSVFLRTSLSGSRPSAPSAIMSSGSLDVFPN